ncbi:MAG: cell division protein FtsZ [Desulfurivibrionaceae bacterium]|nr:cell division protein FtsZ [Desulfobulbales bacterium]MDT8334506.1 cell division protein FtsZ [Desulfurivibrionaceae bacterium]
MSFEFADTDCRAVIKVIGVGGGGGNAINTMEGNNILGVEFIAANTDIQALENSNADIRLQLGPNLAKGLGAGANPERGREAAEESVEEIRKLIGRCDMVFVTAGLGGGTGTGAAPVVARISKELGALTVAVVTKPFTFEGRTRMKNANQGWEMLKKHADTIITIPNDRLLALSGKGGRFIDSMKMADDVLLQAVKGITDTINLPGYINPDFADVKAIMNEMGAALMGAGIGVGENRGTDAINMAIASPLLQDISIDGAKGVLVNISSRRELLSMDEVTEVTTIIHEEAHEEANIILGVTFDESLGEALRVTVIATGINSEDDLPQKVAALGAPRKKVAQTLPFNQKETRSGVELRSTNAKKQRNPFLDVGLDEDKLDTPTFIRRNEN